MNLRRLIPAFTLLLLAGCNILPEAQPDPTRFYVLPETMADLANPAGVTLGLLAPELPAYLTNSRAMAVASSDSQITYRDFDRWAEPLDQGISRVLRTALASQPGIRRALPTPFTAEDVRDYDLRVRVHHCEGLDSGGIRFVLSYEIVQLDGTLVAASTYRAPLGDWSGDPGDLARRLAAAVTAAATTIAADLP